MKDKVTTNPRIRLLADDVVNKIAAGEVIERPVAVVKELLENSLDAGARKLQVEFRHGGKSYIRVEDDGCGMGPDQAMLCLERHATSKLQSAEDLLKIVSMGFRGEALPSIASVSRFTLKTRPEDREQGSEILINGGKLIHHRDCGMPLGTRVEVAHLFASVPARRQFLKTDNTEAAHIVHLVRLYAVARPEVDFTLVEDGRVVFRSPQNSDLKHRVAEIWGAKVAEYLELFPEIAEKDYRAWGLLGRPGTGRSSRREMITLVNRRPVSSRTLSYALIEGYHTFIPKGRYPLAFLFLEISPAAIDVNVHPAKREIRFRDEGRVRRFILEGIHRRLKELASGPLGFSGPSPPDQAAQMAKQLIQAQSPQAPMSEELATPQPSKLPATLRPKVFPQAIATLNRKPFPDQVASESKQSLRPKVTSTFETSIAPSEVLKDIGWHLLGRLKGGQALFETASGLIVMDIRAAHERIWFERIQRTFKVPSDTQPLLLPLSIELEPLTATTLLENLKFFEEQGFAIATFGRHFFRIEAHPVWLSGEDVEGCVMELVEAVREGKLDLRRKDLARNTFAQIASRRAVHLGDAITDLELAQLATRLLRCDQPLICPKGQATYFELTTQAIKKRLGRT